MSDENKHVKIVIIDDEAPIREILSASLQDEGYQVFVAADGGSGLKLIKEKMPDIVFQDIWMPGSIDGIEVLTEARKDFPDTEFIMISGHGTIETAVKATKLGAWDFIEKPLSMDKIFITISNISNFKSEKEEKKLLLNKLRKSIALVGDSAPMNHLRQIISKVSVGSSWLLISGPDGAGKNLTAQNIHYMSTRAGKPFVEIKMSMIPEELQEAELFGIEKGGMPGVDRLKKGKLDLADGGTLYLHDVQDVSSEIQSKLLTVLKEKKYLRVGGGEHCFSDVRIIFSTSAESIDDSVKSGKIRDDLYQRINIIPIQIPNLKVRTTDLPVLVSYFTDELSRQTGYAKKVFSESAMSMMMSYNWPGNIRELKNFLERVYILTPSDYVDVHDIRFAGLVDHPIDSPHGMDDMKTASIDSNFETFREARAEFEKNYLIKKIAENNGNISKTAEVIGLERSYLHRKIKTYGIEEIIKEKI